MTVRYFLNFDSGKGFNLTDLEKSVIGGFREVSAVGFGAFEMGANGAIGEISFSIDGVVDEILGATRGAGNSVTIPAAELALAAGARDDFKLVAVDFGPDNDAIVAELTSKEAIFTNMSADAGGGGMTRNFTMQAADLTWKINAFDAATGAIAGARTTTLKALGDDVAAPAFVDNADAAAGFRAFGPTLGGDEGEARFFMRVLGAKNQELVEFHEIEAFSFDIENSASLSSEQDISGRSRFSQLSVERFLDEDSQLFASLLLDEATNGRIEIVVVDRVGAGFGVVKTYNFLNGVNSAKAPQLVASQDFDTEADGPQLELLGLNFVAIEERVFVGAQPNDLQQVASFTWSTATNLANFKDADEAQGTSINGKAPAGLTFDAATGALDGDSADAGGASSDDIAFFLEIPDFEGGSEDEDFADAFRIGSYEVDLETLELKVTLPDEGDLNGLFADVFKPSLLKDLTLTARNVALDQTLATFEAAATLRGWSTAYQSDFAEDDGAIERTLTFKLPDDESLVWKAFSPDPSNPFTQELSLSEAQHAFTQGDGGSAANLLLPGLDQLEDLGLQAFLQISEIGPGGGVIGQTDFVEIDDFDVALLLSGDIFDAGALSIQRVADDATTKLFELMAEGGAIVARIEVWDEFGDDGWAVIANYEARDAVIEAISVNSPADGGFAEESMDIRFERFAEVLADRNIPRSAGDSRPKIADVTGTEIVIGGDGAEGADFDIAELAPVDRDTGRLETLPIADDPLVNFGFDGLALFLVVDGVESGDGLLDVAFDDFDDAFSVLGYSLDAFNGGDQAFFQGFDVTVAGSQNWAALDTLAFGEDATADVRLVAVDSGADGGGNPGRVIWEIKADDVAFGAAGLNSDLNPTYEVSFGAAFDWIFRESPTGNNANSTLHTTTFDLAAGTVDGVDFDDAGFQGNIGGAWPAFHGVELRAGFEARFFIRFSGGDGDFLEVGDFTIDPNTKQITIDRALDGASVQNLFLAAADQDLPNILELEIWDGAARYFGLAEFVFEGARIVEHTVQIAEGGAFESFAITFDEFQEVVAGYNVLGDLFPLNANSDNSALDGSRAFASDGSVDFTLFGAADDGDGGFVGSFDALSNPIEIEAGPITSALRGGGTPEFLLSGVDAGEFADAPVLQVEVAPLDEFLDLAAAVDAAAPGDVIRILEPGFVAPDTLTISVDDLTIEIADGAFASTGVPAAPGDDLGAAPDLGFPVNAAGERFLNIVLATTADRLTILGDGAVVVSGRSNDNFVQGGDGDDEIDGGFGDDTIDGGDGNDRLTDGAVGADQGVDALSGGEGDDVIVASFANAGDFYDGGAGVDTLDVRLDTLAYDSVVLGAAFTQFAAGFDGFENFFGTEADDTVVGSDDANVIDGHLGDDDLRGGGGDDVIDGGDGGDLVLGEAGDDVLTDQDVGGVDLLEGAGGDDVIVVKSVTAGDAYDGGDDIDTLDLSENPLAFAGANAIDLFLASFTANGATFAGFENVIAGDGNDEIAGGAASTRLEGGEGDDVIMAGGGDETILGGDGDDVITVGGPSDGDSIDQVDGGEGDDRIVVFFSDFGEVIDGGAGVDTLDVSGESEAYTIDLSGPDAEFVQFATFRNFENVVGTDLDDTIIGSAEANEINGGEGRDVIMGGDGDDLIVDDDTFGIAASDDEIDGGAGDDVIRVVTGAGQNVYDGGDDIDTIDLSQNVDEFSGAEAIDLSGVEFTNGAARYRNFENAIGSQFGDDIIGSDGANVLDGHLGADTIDGGGGDDVITDQDSSADTIDGGDGDDLIIVKQITAGDVYRGGADVDTLDLSALPDAVFVFQSGDAFSFGGAQFSGFEIIIGAGAGDDITGSDRNEKFNGGAGGDALSGFGGDDVLTDDDGDSVDALDGGEGDDLIIVTAALNGEFFNGGASGTDTLDLSGHNAGFGANRPIDLRGTGGIIFQNFDIVFATSFGDVIIGSEDAEEIHGAGGRDTISGNGGDDVIEGGAGRDTLDGGGGVNTLSYESSGDGVTLNLKLATVSGGHAEGDAISLFQNARGSAFDDMLTGDDGANALAGGDGDDVLDGGLGGDAMDGGIGDDTFHIDDAGDTVADGGGVDSVISSITYDLPGGFENLTFTADAGDVDGQGNQENNTIIGSNGANQIKASGGDDVVMGGLGDDTLNGQSGDDELHGGDGLDFLTGKIGDDRLFGGADNDQLRGEEGDDHMEGGGAKDRMIGKANDDVLLGQEANDKLFGNGGEDIIVGGVGKDSMNGGADADIFVLAPGDQVDTIKDFEVGIDQLDVSAFGFADFAEVEALMKEKNGRVQINLDGSDDVVRLNGVLQADLSEPDFIL